MRKKKREIFSGVLPVDESIVIELSVLRPLVPDGLLLKVPISTPFLPTDSSIAVDARRVFKLLENKQVFICLCVTLFLPNGFFSLVHHSV